MHSAQRTFAGLWGGFCDTHGGPVQAYPDGCAMRSDVQLPPMFPYITYPSVFGTNVPIAVSVWDRSSAHLGHMHTVLHILAQIAAAIPEDGVMLHGSDHFVGTDKMAAPHSLIWLYRGTNFQAIIPQPTPDIVRGVTNLVVRGYGY